MLFNDARRYARFAAGAIVLLSDQDRSLWDSEGIAEGDRALALVDTDAERRFLETRLAEIRG
jgi:predicted RNA polymerase sigma factor